MAQEKILTTNEVFIKPVTVEIKVMRVGKKQMTQAVYRQLKEEWPFDKKLNWTGNPWGTINYCEKHCPREEHRHVIWQKGNELRKICISKTFKETYHAGYSRWNDLRSELEIAYAAAALESDDIKEYFGKRVKVSSNSGRIETSINGTWEKYCFVHFYKEEHPFVRAKRGSGFTCLSKFENEFAGKTGEEAAEEFENKIKQELKNICGGLAREIATSPIEEAVRKNDEILCLWSKRCQEIALLDQLFIAV